MRNERYHQMIWGHGVLSVFCAVMAGEDVLIILYPLIRVSRKEWRCFIT